MSEKSKIHKQIQASLIEKTTLVSRKGAPFSVRRLTLSKRGMAALTSASKGIKDRKADEEHSQQEAAAA